MTTLQFCEEHSPCREGRKYAINFGHMSDVWQNCTRPDWLFWINPHFPALRSGPTAALGTSLQKQIPSSSSQQRKQNHRRHRPRALGVHLGAAGQTQPTHARHGTARTMNLSGNSTSGKLPTIHPSSDELVMSHSHLGTRIMDNFPPRGKPPPTTLRNTTRPQTTPRTRKSKTKPIPTIEWRRGASQAQGQY